MANRQELISVVELQLTKGKPSDDFELDHRQIGAELDRVADELMSEMLNGKIRAYGDIDTAYLKLQILPVEIEDLGIAVGHYNIMSKLKSTPLNLDQDKGLYRVLTDNNQEVRRVVANRDEWMFRHLRFARPTQDNITFHRSGDLLYFQGMAENYDIIENMLVYYVPSLTGMTEAEKELDYPISTEVANMAVEEVVRILRNQLSSGLYDVENDGVQNGE